MKSLSYPASQRKLLFRGALEVAVAHPVIRGPCEGYLHPLTILVFSPVLSIIPAMASDSAPSKTTLLLLIAAILVVVAFVLGLATSYLLLGNKSALVSSTAPSAERKADLALKPRLPDVIRTVRSAGYSLDAEG